MSNMQNAIQRATTAAPATNTAPTAPAAAKGVGTCLNAILDSEGYRKRFDELLGKRSPQFISSIISIVNATPELQKAAVEAPQTIIQAGLKAAMMDLPIENALGYAYIVPFKNSIKQQDGSFKKRSEAAFILGWRGMHQLALRTGVYKTINVVDIRQGELKKYNRLTEEAEVDFVEDEDQRMSLPVIGYLGYYRLINGAEKTIYMTVAQINAHEKANRKGAYQTKGWRDNWDAMARKTVYRQLIGKWGVMSIDYRTAPEAAQMADWMAQEGGFGSGSEPIEAGYVIQDDEPAALPETDPNTGEIVEG